MMEKKGLWKFHRCCSAFIFFAAKGCHLTHGRWFALGDGAAFSHPIRSRNQVVSRREPVLGQWVFFFIH